MTMATIMSMTTGLTMATIMSMTTGTTTAITTSMAMLTIITMNMPITNSYRVDRCCRGDRCAGDSARG